MRYLFLASLTYALPVLRPLQKAIRARGGEVAWFLDEPDCERFVREDETVIRDVKTAIEYNPVAVFAAVNHMYDFLPGVKVQLFHGFNINKRAKAQSSHFDLRGWFDLYCTQGPTSTVEFTRLARKHGYFTVVETGWTKLDGFFENGKLSVPHNRKPVILYTSTFTRHITSTPYLYTEIERLIKERDWEWLITFHPKMPSEVKENYRGFEKYSNVTYYDGDNNVELLKKADVMVSDSSSIIIEFLYLGKPAVTFRNTQPGDWLIDINEPAMLEDSIDTALSRPLQLMENIKAYIDLVNPYYDGKSSERVLDAVDKLLAGELGPLKRKPLNLFRKWQMRRKLGLSPFFRLK